MCGGDGYFLKAFNFALYKDYLTIDNVKHLKENSLTYNREESI
jgi:hypothetical protein